MAKLDDLLAQAKLKELLNKNSIVVEEKKKSNPIVWILAVVGAITAIAAIAYAVYRYLTPDYLEDFEDEEFEDEDEDFDDDFFEEDEETEE